MALSTRDEIVARIKTVVPAATPELCQHWADLAWERLEARRNWSWRLKKTAIYIPAAYLTGAITVNLGSTTVEGTGGATFSSEMVGRQLRVGEGPLYTIIDVPDSLHLTLSVPWADTSGSGVSYTILQAYLTPPEDFQEWVTVVDSENEWLLNLDVTQDELDARDPNRRFLDGTPSILAGVEYLPDYAGQTHEPFYIDTVGGAGWPYIFSRGAYSGAEDAVFVIHLNDMSPQTFRWKKEGATSWSSNTPWVVDTWYALADAVEIQFPTQWGDFPAPYGADSFWVVRVSAKPSPGLPMYELYPHQSAARTLTGYYITKSTTLDERGGLLPRYIRGDVLLELALAQAASWPGPDELHPSPYDQISRREWHTAQSEALIVDLERVDNGVMQRDLSHLDLYRFAPLPWGGVRQEYAY